MGKGCGAVLPHCSLAWPGWGGEKRRESRLIDPWAAAEGFPGRSSRKIYLEAAGIYC